MTSALISFSFVRILGGGGFPNTAIERQGLIAKATQKGQLN
jgi:hypothetical protein